MSAHAAAQEALGPLLSQRRLRAGLVLVVVVGGAHLGRRGRGLGRLLDAGLHAKHVPRDIRAQVFAAHSARGRALDGRAFLGGDRASTGYPLIHSGGCHVEGFGESCLAAQHLTGFADGVHGEAI